jgi:hypothetical protein
LDAGNLIDIRFANNIYTKDFGERIENVRFKDIRLEGPNQLPNRILGLNADRVVSGVTFDGLWIDGQHVLSREDGDFEINAFVEDLEFR